MVVQFMESRRVYHALSVLKERIAEGRIGPESAAVV